MIKRLLVLIILVAISLTIPLTSPICSATDIEYFTINLVDDEGKDAPNVLQPSYTCDTDTTISGTVFYLKAHRAISVSSVNLLIGSDSGEFNSYVTMVGLSSYLAESGIRVELSYNEQTYHADLKSDNQFKEVYFVDQDGSPAVLEPNIKYPITVRPLNDISSTVPPESVENVIMEFTAHMKKGFHQIVFISEEEIVSSYKLLDGQAILPLPVIERDGYTLDGWFTQDGKQIVEGYVVTADDQDIISYAKWTPNGSDDPGKMGAGFSWWWLIILIITICTLLAYWHHRRRVLIT